jgi:beta-1,4-mannooligosaccharide/beta-1,4-mannosyl-N-acetylglucosamine phosphorylase
MTGSGEGCREVNPLGSGSESLFSRYEKNPILTADRWPYPANAVFNPGAAEVDGETLLLVRVEDMRGFSHLTAARSKDGKTNWRIDRQPTLAPDPNFREEQWGLEDARIVWLADRQEYGVTYTSFSIGGPVVSLATTKDFRTFTRHGALLPPEDKDASLFPRLFDGRYVLIHRPIIRGEAHIWISCSPDLKHWGDHEVLIPTRQGWWDSQRVGLCAQPVETPDGWLILYHGVRRTSAGDVYRVGLALLDLEDPCKLIRRSEEWVFGPKAMYERIGDVADVVFPTGAIVDRKTNELRIYYGAADTSVALAVADLDQLSQYIKTCPGYEP